jgi:hypothetical protein
MFFQTDILKIPSHLRSGAFTFMSVRTDQRWVEGVGASNGKLGSGARVWRSLDVVQHAYAEPAERGKHDNNNEEDFRVGSSGEVWRRSDSQDLPRRQRTQYGAFE